MEFSRQEYWSGLSSLPPGDLPDSGIISVCPMSPVLAGGFFITEPPGNMPPPPRLYNETALLKAWSVASKVIL